MFTLVSLSYCQQKNHKKRYLQEYGYDVLQTQIIPVNIVQPLNNIYPYPNNNNGQIQHLGKTFAVTFPPNQHVRPFILQGPINILQNPPGVLQNLPTVIQHPQNIIQNSGNVLQSSANVLQNPSNVLQNPSNVLQNPLNVLQNPPNVLQNPSNVLQIPSNGLQNLPRVIQNPTNVLQNTLQGVIQTPANVYQNHANVLQSPIIALIRNFGHPSVYAPLLTAPLTPRFVIIPIVPKQIEPPINYAPNELAPQQVIQEAPQQLEQQPAQEPLRIIVEGPESDHESNNNNNNNDDSVTIETSANVKNSNKRSKNVYLSATERNPTAFHHQNVDNKGSSFEYQLRHK